MTNDEIDKHVKEILKFAGEYVSKLLADGISATDSAVILNSCSLTLLHGYIECLKKEKRLAQFTGIMAELKASIDFEND